MRIEFIAKQACTILGIMLGLFAASGCGEDSNIPASKGGEEARAAIEYPLGPPPASKNAKKKSAKPAPAPSQPTGPGMAH